MQDIVKLVSDKPFPQANSKLYVPPILMAEAVTVCAIPSLCQEKVAAVALVATPPEDGADIPGVAHVLETSQPSLVLIIILFSQSKEISRKEIHYLP